MVGDAEPPPEPGRALPAVLLPGEAAALLGLGLAELLDLVDRDRLPHAWFGDELRLPRDGVLAARGAGR